MSRNISNETKMIITTDLMFILSRRIIDIHFHEQNQLYDFDTNVLLLDEFAK